MEQANLFKAGFYAATLTENDFPLNMIQDVLNFDTIPDADLDKITSLVKESADYIKSFEDLCLIIDPVFTPERSYLTASISRILANIRKSSLQQIHVQLILWIFSNKENQVILSSEQLKKIINKLEEFCLPLVAFDKARKVKELQTATGNQLQNIEIFNNVRPVFNEERTQIEDNVYFMTLKMDYTDQTQSEHTFEISLDQEDLDLLLKKILLAQRKLRIIQKTNSDKQVP